MVVISLFPCRGGRKSISRFRSPAVTRARRSRMWTRYDQSQFQSGETASSQGRNAGASVLPGAVSRDGITSPRRAASAFSFAFEEADNLIVGELSEIKSIAPCLT